MKLIRRVTVVQEQIIDVTKQDMDLEIEALFLKYEELISSTPFKDIELKDYEHFFLE